VIVTVILLGKYLAELAKGRTSAAIKEEGYGAELSE